MTAVARITDDAWADEQYQQALRVLSDRHARAYEAARPIREAVVRQEIAAWQEHIDGCNRRAAAHDAAADALPKSHKDYVYYRNLAAEQRGMAAWARSRITLQEADL